MPEPQTSRPASALQSVRQRLMSVCAGATEVELQAALGALEPLPTLVDLRTPETGLVMLRGRIGGSGAPFNFGEATVARATIQLETGELGFGYVLGRSQRKARLAAIVDALGQIPGWHAKLEEMLVGPVVARIARDQAIQDHETADTRVNFFTLARGED